MLGNQTIIVIKKKRLQTSRRLHLNEFLYAEQTFKILSPSKANSDALIDFILKSSCKALKKATLSKWGFLQF